MNILKKLAVPMLGLILAACGGGGGSAGSPPFGDGSGTPPDPATVPASIEFVATATQVGTAGGEVALSAFVKNSTNGLIASTPIAFTTDTGNLSGVSSKTDANGLATAKFSPGADRTNRTATITARAGTVTQSLTIAIVGTSLAYSGPTTFTQGDVTRVSIKATDSTGNVLPNFDINVTSSLGNGLSATAVRTDGQGTASVTYTATRAGSDTLAFSGGGASTEASFTISGENFRFVSPDASASTPQVIVGDTQVVTVRYISGGAPKSGVTVNFAATAGQLAAVSAVTNGAGEASVSISSDSAVAATVQATLNNAGVIATATLPLQFVASTPASLVLQVSPSAIGPNPAGSTGQQAQVQARVTDAKGNPVANRTVNFSRISDPSGGNLSQPSAVTDLNGEATVQYLSGPQSTANNAVILKGTVADAPTVYGTTTLTVNQSALFIALGTGNTINNIDPQTYKKDWVVYVTDANSVPVPNVQLTIRALPEGYLKGSLWWDGNSWTYRSNGVIECPNEDVNFNGQLDANENDGSATSPIDNGDGSLQPGNVISVTPGTVRTGAAGTATVSLIYAESYAPWVRLRLTATAIVNGTESSTSNIFIVDGASQDFSREDLPPAGVVSPYGTNLSCTVPN